MVKDTYVKNDLNLLPKKVGVSSFTRIGLPIIVIAVMLAGALTAGIIIPQNIKAGKLAEKDRLNKQIATYANVQSEFDSLKQEIAVINSQLNGFEEFKSTKINLNNMLDTIEQNCPSTVKIDKADFDYEKITLTGLCDSDSEVAGFSVKLRSTGIFSEINIDTVQFNQETASAAVSTPPEVPATPAPKLSKRSFQMVLYYPVKEAKDSADDAAGTKASDSEASGKESDAKSSNTKESVVAG